MLQANLRNEFSGRESQIRSALLGDLSSEQAKLFCEVPDVYYGAAVLVQNGFYVGRGDITEIIRKFMKYG